MKVLVPMGERCWLQTVKNVPLPLWPLNRSTVMQEAVKATVGLGEVHVSPLFDLAVVPGFSTVLPRGCHHVVLEPTPGAIQTLLQMGDCVLEHEEVIVQDARWVLEATEVSQAITVFRESQASAGFLLSKGMKGTCLVTVSPDWTVMETVVPEDGQMGWYLAGLSWWRSGSVLVEALRRARAAHETEVGRVFSSFIGSVKGFPVSAAQWVGDRESYLRVQEGLRCLSK